MKKTVIETHVIPAEVIAEKTVEVMGFKCEDCEFSTVIEDDAFRHWFDKHSGIKRRYVNGSEYYYFPTTQAIAMWKEAECANGPNYPALKEPGWYRSWNEEGPCGRGCCTRTSYYMDPVGKHYEELREKFNETIDTMRTLRRMMRGETV